MQLCKRLESSFKVDRKREGFDVQLLRTLGRHEIAEGKTEKETVRRVDGGARGIGAS